MTGRVIGKHEALTGQSGRRPPVAGTLSVSREQLETGRVDGDSVGAAVLGRAQDSAPRPFNERSPEPDRRVLEVDVVGVHDVEESADLLERRRFELWQ